MSEYKGSRSAFAAALTDMAETDKRLVFVSADSLKSMRANGFAAKYPDRYFEAGISEQSAVDISAGLATCGLIPFLGTYAGFITMRACEQVRTFVAYPNLNVKFVGINGGILGGEKEGTTHQTYEDIAILSAIPNIAIFTPADPEQTYEAVKLAAEIEGPVYVRAGSGNEKDFFPAGTPFAREGFRLIKEYGNDVTVFSSGFLVKEGNEAAEILKEKGINVSYYDVNIIRKENPAELIEVIKKAERILTVEDHSIHGGLGAYISELAAENHPVRTKRIGLTTFGESGAAEDLAVKYGLTAENIALQAEAMLR